jgi:divalent metal cation (Fe/Co/Zn/Cd) transporter
VPQSSSPPRWRWRAITLTVAAIDELVAHSVPEHSLFARISAGISALVLAPLGWAKYRTGRLLGSHALMGDGTLSAIGAALGVLALLGLLAEQLLGWWWADRVTALCVALVAASEAFRVIRMRPD